MSETWRTIDAAPGYAVSDQGRVKRLADGPGTWAGRLKEPSLNAYGYLCVNLALGDGKKRVFTVHRLVCLAFHGPPPSPKHEAAHGDGDKGNNAAGNLRWVMPVENSADRMRHGTHRSDGKRLSARQVHAIRSDPRRHRLIAHDFGITRQHVSRIKTGERCRVL